MKGPGVMDLQLLLPRLSTVHKASVRYLTNIHFKGKPITTKPIANTVWVLSQWIRQLSEDAQSS